MDFKKILFQMNMKSKMRNCFRAANLYFTKKIGDRTIYIYPKVHAIVEKEQENCTEITFTLMNGLDPNEVKKKLYTFKQVFGNAIELKGEIKKFTLHIYHKPLQSNLIYNYKEIFSYLEGMDFPIVVGKNKNGQYIVIDTLETPHVIIQGTTGSGKSSAIRVILTTLIKFKRPSELDIYLIDGKKAEFGLFKKVEHVQAVVHSAKHVKKLLNEVSNIMSAREDLLDQFDVPHINDLPKEHKQKLILVAVDEFIEYLDNKDIMEHIIKISSKGRAVGIILLASAQRMDADVMNTKARGNFNIRMSFRAVDKTNAKLIGCEGAEKITKDEKGRLIFNCGELMELQNPHLTYEEAKKLLNPFCVSKTHLKDVTDVFKDSNTNTLPSGLKRLENDSKRSEDTSNIFME